MTKRSERRIGDPLWTVHGHEVLHEQGRCGVADGHDLALKAFKQRYVTGGGEDGHAFPRQSCCDRAAEALAGAGDESRLSPKWTCPGLPPDL
ncbi:hypothetical protein GWA01_08300 [Gluconobacter wancherniae NBRC 103581]|uniref:Uncharacterized protein n=1 Tax=Gluconobacter wancherniae NBRC 103581 TaxID=656744 RepID=A0A511AXX3_9PROT|nr:hypothetical protein AA103581_0627 [Gluconobacter wancherniae NBRC 103581]GEK93060.1 hypothetical protein GWA01_08300 [Gluconobacter wancherniae NBRC 103581]